MFDTAFHRKPSRLPRVQPWMVVVVLFACGCTLSQSMAEQADPDRHRHASRLAGIEDVRPLPGPGGANAPKPSEPREMILPTRVIETRTFAIRVPTGEFTAPRGGVPAYSVPGPIVSFRGSDGVWRGLGYLETYPRLQRFTSTTSSDGKTTELHYTFDQDASYRVKLTATDDRIIMEETSNLGPRNRFVFDCFYHWQPTFAFASNLDGSRYAFLYLPCHYDKAEVTVRPLRLTDQAAAPAKPDSDSDSDGDSDSADAAPAHDPGNEPAGVAVLADGEGASDIVGFWSVKPQTWEGADSMGMQLWQRRQLAGDPGSRHFIAPETKSDGTPNPHTPGMIGQSRYEGHVTIELNLGQGTRTMHFAVFKRHADKDRIATDVLQQVHGKP